MNIREMKKLVTQAITETDRRAATANTIDARLYNLAKRQIYTKVLDALNGKPDGLKCDI